MLPEVFTLVFASALCHALWNLAARRVSGDLVVLWLGFGVGAALIFPFAAYLWYLNPVTAFPPASFKFIALTGIIHAIYTGLLSCAYRHGEISVVYPVARGSGVAMTTILGVALLGEQVSGSGFVGVLLVLLATHCFGIPALLSVRAKRGYFFALGVGSTIAVYSLVDKTAVSIVHPVLYIWAMFSLSFLLLWPLVLRLNDESILPRVRALWRYVAVVGSGYLISYLLMLFALTLGPVSYLVAARESSVALGAALGIIFLKERLTFLKLLAIAFMTAGVICLKSG